MKNFDAIIIGSGQAGTHLLLSWLPKEIRSPLLKKIKLAEHA